MNLIQDLGSTNFIDGLLDDLCFNLELTYRLDFWKYLQSFILHSFPGSPYLASKVMEPKFLDWVHTRL